MSALPPCIAKPLTVKILTARKAGFLFSQRMCSDFCIGIMQIYTYFYTFQERFSISRVYMKDKMHDQHKKFYNIYFHSFIFIVKTCILNIQSSVQYNIFRTALQWLRHHFNQSLYSQRTTPYLALISEIRGCLLRIFEKTNTSLYHMELKLMTHSNNNKWYHSPHT